MVATRALALLFAVSGCSGDVRVTDGASGGGAANTGGAAASDGGAGGSGPSLSVWPGQTYSSASCEDAGMRLFIEIWPDASNEEACSASPEIDPFAVLVMGIEGWDFTAGVFPLNQTTLHGTARASLAGSAENASGSLTLEPFTEVPGIIRWDLDFAAGSTDLALCYRPPEEPCATPN